MARDEGWMAEHMLILKLTSPEGEVKYITGAFPSACGKTNLAMLIPTLAGWKVETVGDDIAWMKFGDDGRLYAINPEAGFFGVAPGTGEKTNPNAMATIEREHDLHQLRADRRRRHLVGGHDRASRRRTLIDWHGNDWTPDVRRRRPRTRTPASPPRPRRPRRSPPSGRTRPACRSTPSSSAAAARPSCRWCARRSTGSTASSSARRCRSETTAAAAGAVGQLRFDPFAMLPFCGYNMADYFAHWLKIGERGDADKLPKIFYVNWFRKDDDGKFLWPASARTAACSSGSSAAATARARPSRRRSASCPPPATSTSTGSTSTPARSSSC